MLFYDYLRVSIYNYYGHNHSSHVSKDKEAQDDHPQVYLSRQDLLSDVIYHKEETLGLSSEGLHLGTPAPVTTSLHKFITKRIVPDFRWVHEI